jgi:hypothetical protein
VISLSTVLGLFIGSLIHKTASMTLNFHESNFSAPLSQFFQKRENDIKVHYLLQVRMKVMSAPLAYDIEKDQLVHKYENGGMAAMTDSYIP